MYDVLGRLVVTQEKPATDLILTISELSLAEGEYFVKLSAKNYNYSTNLLNDGNENKIELIAENQNGDQVITNATAIIES